jgi:hypothetical protein
MPSEVEHKLAAILSADVVGYSRPRTLFHATGCAQQTGGVEMAALHRDSQWCPT